MGMNLLGRRRVRWMVVVQLVALLGCLVLSTVVYRYFEVCVPESRAALTEFPAFGDTEIDPDPNYLGSEGDCGVSYFTTEPADRVIGYYRQQLSARGWKVQTLSEEQVYGGSSPGGEHPDTLRHSRLVGERDGLCYYVITEAYPRSDPPVSKSVSVQVMRTDSGSKLSPAGGC